MQRMTTAEETIAMAMEMEMAMETPLQLEPEREVPVMDPLGGQVSHTKSFTSRRMCLKGSIAQAALEGEERELEAVTSLYDCVQERVDVLLTAKDALEGQVENLISDYEAAEFDFGELWQEVVGLRGEREELQDAIDDHKDELQCIQRIVKVETAFLLAQPYAQHAGEDASSPTIRVGGLGDIAAFWWSLVWPI